MKSYKGLHHMGEAWQANLVGRGMHGLAGVGLNSRVFWLLFNDRKSNMYCRVIIINLRFSLYRVENHVRSRLVDRLYKLFENDDINYV